MTKICHITTMHQVFDTRIFKKECVSLVKNGYDVILIAPHDKEEIVEGVRIIPIRSRTSFVDRIYHLPKLAMDILDRVDADLFHFHDPELFPYLRQFSKKGKKVVWDAHENYRDTIKSFNSLKLKPISYLGSEFFNWMELNASKNQFSGVVTITEKMAQKYRAKGINTCVLGNFAKVSHFEYKGVPNIAKKPRLISSGAHFRPRAIIEIAQSFKYIQQKLDAEVYFSGKFIDQNLKDEVTQIANELDPSRDNIIIEGALEYKDLINRAIPQAWVGTVLFDISDPNNRNGLPNRFFECWANGVPVIATAGTQVAEVIQKNGGGIVIENNAPEAIAKAFIKIVSDKDYRNKLSQEAFECVSTKMNWESNFQDLLAFYKKILT